MKGRRTARSAFRKGCVIALVGLSATACSDFPAGPVGPPTGGSLQASGRTLSGTVTTMAEVEHRDGTAVTGELLVADRFSAVVRNGVARLDLASDAAIRGPDDPAASLRSLRIAVAEKAYSPEVTERAFRDELGRAHNVVFTVDGGRILKTVHYVDGMHFATMVNDWYLEDGMWLLRSTVVSAEWLGNRATIRTHVAADVGSRDLVAAGAEWGAYLVDSSLGVLGPSPAYASAPPPCMGQLMVFAGASMGVVATVSNPFSFWAVGAAVMTYSGALYMYQDCVLSASH